MINNIKDEPLIKRTILMLGIGIVFIMIVNLLLNCFFAQEMYNEHINGAKQLVGAITKMYPNDESKIVRLTLIGHDSKAYDYGDKILKKYGYDNQVTVFKDEKFSQDIKYIFLSSSIVFLLMAMLLMYIVTSSNLFLIKKLTQISNNIDGIINNDFSIKLDDVGEGILSKINIQFYQMARTVKMSFNNLNIEKENIKSLITDISHQLKTPLASIKMYNAILIEDTDITKDEKDEFLQTSKNEINKLEWLIGSLVKLSRLEVGMIELKVKNESIKKTVYDAVESIRAKALQKKLDIIIDIKDEYFLPHDYRWTKEAISNVLENAVKYSYNKGSIKIDMVNMTTYIRIDISDNGIGIPESDFNNIFKRFFRGNSETVKAAEGSGVGLYLTRKIIENEGGSIMVDSVINKGTTFSLFFQKCK